MSYVNRDQAGNITNIFACEQYEGQEFVIEPVLYAPVPMSLTMRQARLALHNAALLSSIPVIIASLPSPQRETAEIEWEFSNTVTRDNQLMLLIAISLGLDNAELDALFLQGSLL